MKTEALLVVNLVQLSRIQSHDQRGRGDGGSFAVGVSMTSGRTTGALPSAGKQS